MGFCRRCGNIVVGEKCKCGGTAVAPVVQWTTSKELATDKWSQTYVSSEKSPTRPLSRAQPPDSDSTFQTPSGSATQNASSSAVKRLPRKNSIFDISSAAGNRSSIHIGSNASRPPSPLKYSVSSSNVHSDAPPSPTTISAAAGILPSPYAPELSKAYGSVLQPKESLASYCCGICFAVFPPDATIYPDPSAPAMDTDRFLCRPCFVQNGGSKGDCPSCDRPVLIVKSEGGFVETSGRVWHKRCFCCDGCHKSIGDNPMVDLLGRPSCADCFESCLKRDNTPRKPHKSPGIERIERNHLGGFRGDSTSRQGSPAIDELEQRLGIMKSREGSPVMEELTARLNAVLNRTPSKDAFPTPSALTSRSINGTSWGESPIAGRIPERKLPQTFSPFGSPVSTLDGNSSPQTDFWRSRSPDVGEHKTTPSSHIRQPFGTPETNFSVSSGRPSFDAIEEMKKRFLPQSPSSPGTRRDANAPSSSSSSPSFQNNSPVARRLDGSRIPLSKMSCGSPGLRSVASTSSLSSARLSWAPSTPELISDMSDNTTQSSSPSSPPFSPSMCHAGISGNDGTRYSLDGSNDSFDSEQDNQEVYSTPTPKSAKQALNRLSIPAATLSPDSLCAKCGGSLFASRATGRFVTVPEPSATGPPKTYHPECFRCVMCDGPFKESGTGQAVFTRGEGGAYHVECAPPERVQVRSTAVSGSITSRFPLSSSPSPPSEPRRSIERPTVSSTAKAMTRASMAVNTSPYSSSRLERSSAPAVSTAFPRFGSSTVCPACSKPVSPMEMGVVPGPQGSRWHATCLICGGRGVNKARRDKSQPGCSKKLDSAAKRDVEGGVWCRECLLLLPANLRSAQAESPTKPLVPSLTGRSIGGIQPQFTGTTTIARQFTGLRGGDPALMRQLTGGGLSPTKQLGSATPRPRPKSVIGMRSGKSVDEGRGMFLVRQMTSGGSFV
ncbi:hypothetical protein K503DRAFT_728370 [Rhizopogon vinicolor AM-OR11-026]|uniref:LIM zinc-binding domain-containing protein n=1 Tax=Rhizopogon vinicolor AM-OR11-026 TaxID=1314800 RepID=A0A1B7NIH2_9AGAM|nr:hypothetical protein K503DRAFT_728370 [Rhizopogon vinicolor AM-OR11-026]